MQSLLVPTLLLGLLTEAGAINFPFEETQLTEVDIERFGFPALSFGDPSTAAEQLSSIECKPTPDSDAWPAQEDWDKLTEFLGDALLKPSPPNAVCYSGHPLENDEACIDIRINSGSNRFYIEDPVTVLTSWPQGDTCPLNPSGEDATCEQGGFPEYVVNVTEVWEIQAAVNFARNNNLRLIIKNTGHDFLGRSSGHGSISVWTHWLKHFEFIPEYIQGEYSGMAARVGSGLESWELYQYMDEHRMTLVTPGRYTVGVYGGWFQGGGHSALASYKGMGADQILSLQVVTADGRFVTADTEQNTDLFYALRGGGPSTYGIVTSAIVKAHPPVEVKNAPLQFGTSDEVDVETFWLGVNYYHWYGKAMADLGGTSYNYVTWQSNTSFSFTADNEFPDLSDEEIVAYLQPLWDTLRDIGIPVRDIEVNPTANWAPSSNAGVGDRPGNSRFASRLFSQSLWEDADAFDEMMQAVREVVEARYTFHGIVMAPRLELAGWPGESSAVNPAFRDTYMHADIFYVGDIREEETKFNQVMERLRVASPGGGAYINEADVEEPNWQQAFFGDNYERLLEVKKERDPWNLFWAPSTVGSEGWAVRTDDELPSQNGPLCKVGGKKCRKRSANKA